MKNINSYLTRRKGLVFLWLVFTLCVSFLAPLKAFQLKWLIDATSKEEALQYILVSFLVILLNCSFEFISRTLYTKIAVDAVHNVRIDVMKNAIYRSYLDYSNEKDAKYLSLLTSDIRALYDDYYMSIFEIVFWGAIALVALGMFLYLSPTLLILAILVSIPPLLIPKFFNVHLRTARIAYSNEMEHYTQHLKELLGGFEVIRNFMREDFFLKTHECASNNNAKKEYAYQQSLTVIGTLTGLMSHVIFCIILLFGVFMVYDGKITLGTMTTATSLINFVISPCHRITQAYARLRGAKGIRDKFELILKKTVNEQEAGFNKIKKINNVSCRSLIFNYPDSPIHIFNNANISFSANEKIALLGKSGCGKSTFAKILYQYYPEYLGNIYAGQVELKSIERLSWYKSVGYITQNTFLFNDTIRNNICLYQSFSEEEINKAICMSGMSSFIASLPEGIDTMIEENGINISGGQRQRIGIARMVIRHYEMVIADEISANLDAETTEQVMQNLLDLPCTMIVITHDIRGQFMDRFDQIYHIEQGQFVKQPVV